MHMTTLRRIESGEQEPRLSEIKALSQVLGTSVELLMRDAEEYEDKTRKKLESARNYFTEKLADAAVAYREFQLSAEAYKQVVTAARDSGWQGDELDGADVLLSSFDHENGPARFNVVMQDPKMHEQVSLGGSFLPRIPLARNGESYFVVINGSVVEIPERDTTTEKP